MRVEQEQRLTEDARRFSEQDAAAQRYAAQVLQVSLITIYLNACSGYVMIRNHYLRTTLIRLAY